MNEKKIIAFISVFFILTSLSVSYSIETGKRIYEKKNIISCGKKNGGGSGGGSTGGGSQTLEQGYILLKIKNANSNSPVSQAQIFVNGTPTALSSENGIVYFSTPPGDYNIKIIAQSFAPYSFKTKVSKDEISYFDIKLAPYRFSQTFNAQLGGEIKDESTGTKIIFQGGGLRKKSDGTLYTGNAVINIAYLDPQRADQLFGFPGNFVGVNSNGEKVLLETFGPMEVKIFSEDLSQELDLPPGVTAYVEFQVPDSLKNSTPETVPLWYFNESSGEWVYEGLLVKSINEDGKEILKGYVSHFSWWNPDIPSETTCIQGVIKDEKGNPISGAQVWSEGVDYTGGDFTGASRKTGADGKFFVFVRKAGKAKIIANINGVKREIAQIQTTMSYPSYYFKDWIQNPSSAWNICPIAGDFTIRNIKIILRWGNKKCDLDLHITGPKPSSGRFHIAKKLWGQINTDPYAEIESEDCEEDYPEMAYIDPTVAGIYRVSVFHNNPNDTNCGRFLKDAGALIQVWHRGKVVFTASPPPHGNGDLWKAIDITVATDGSLSITEVREVVDGDYCSPYHPDPSYETPCPQNQPPSASFSVPSQVDGSSVVYIPYYISDPDGDNIRILAYQDGQSGEFIYGDGFVAWYTPSVRSPKNFNLSFVVDDRKGGRVVQTHSVLVNPPTVLKIWETALGIGASVFGDAELLTSDESIYTINDQWWADPVVKISKSGKISAQRNFSRVFDVAITSGSVYIAYDLGAGIFGLGKYSHDLATTFWEIALTTSGRHFAKLYPVSDGLYVVFSTNSNYIIRKYNFDGGVVWETTSPRAGSVSRCHDRCMKVNPTNGDIYISIFEDFSSGPDQQRILRVSSSGSILATKIFNDWSPVVVLPYNNSVYIVRLWLLIEKYDLDMNTLISSVNIWSYPELEDFWISELSINSGYLYGVGGKSFYNSNMEFVRESMAITKFDLNLNLIYGKVLGISTQSDSERMFGSVISGNYLYVVGGYQVANIFYPIVVKYRIP